MSPVALDVVWILLAAFLVFFMQAGFAMVESGMTRAKAQGKQIGQSTIPQGVQEENRRLRSETPPGFH